MGEYYDWINVDRKEFICPSDFGYGSKRRESLCRKNDFLNALRELLSTEWKGGHVLFMGDETKVSAESENEAIKLLYGHTVQCGYAGDAASTICESYKNISGLFKTAKSEVCEEIELYLESLKSGENYLPNQYGIDVTDPFKGLFQRSGRDFPYTINHTKRVFYSFKETKILHLDGRENDFVDPLPLLMAYGRTTGTGIWAGDIVGVSSEKPKGYELLKEIHLDW